MLAHRGILLSYIDCLTFIFVGFLRYELAEDCADDDDAKVEICQLRKNVLEELKMHNSFVEVNMNIFSLSLSLLIPFSNC